MKNMQLFEAPKYKETIDFFRRYFLFCIFAITIALAGCSQNKNTETGKNEIVYIGDNSKVIGIVNQLPYPKGVSYSTIEIQSGTEPYELKVFLARIPENTDSLQECADRAFEQISNMGIISFYDKAGNTLIKSYERE